MWLCCDNHTTYRSRDLSFSYVIVATRRLEPPFTIPESEYHLVLGMVHSNEWRNTGEHTIFAGDAGMDILAHGLAMYGITE